MRGSAKKRKLGSVGRPPAKLAFRPQNYKDLLELIPPCHRAKPTAAGQHVIYIPHDGAVCTSIGSMPRSSLPSRATRTLTGSPSGKPLSVENGNPYVAMDSTNVFLEPPKDVNTATFCNVGVYILYCEEALQKFYVGEFNNTSARIERHRKGQGAKATK